jgi:hypothetical protein
MGLTAQTTCGGSAQCFWQHACCSWAQEYGPQTAGTKYWKGVACLAVGQKMSSVCCRTGLIHRRVALKQAAHACVDGGGCRARTDEHTTDSASCLPHMGSAGGRGSEETPPSPTRSVLSWTRQVALLCRFV